MALMWFRPWSPKTNIMKIKITIMAGLLILLSGKVVGQEQPDPSLDYSGQTYPLYPKLLDYRPDLPSPYLSEEGEELVLAVTQDGKYAIIPVSLSNETNVWPPFVPDEADFPTFAKTGLHDAGELARTLTITSRSVEEITALARPGGLSSDGFLAADEDILAVLKADNDIVTALGLTHPKMAWPLFHILNMMSTDLDLNRWNMAHHRWEHIQYLIYNDQVVMVDAHDTKGGQRSVFNDGIEGGFFIIIWREPSRQELIFLRERYPHLPQEEFEQLIQKLSHILTGEMEPQYIMRYGFYEGHTSWRTDPVALAFIFGLRTVEELEAAFPGRLPEVLTRHFTADDDGDD